MKTQNLMFKYTTLSKFTILNVFKKTILKQEQAIFHDEFGIMGGGGSLKILCINDLPSYPKVTYLISCK